MFGVICELYVFLPVTRGVTYMHTSCARVRGPSVTNHGRMNKIRDMFDCKSVCSLRDSLVLAEEAQSTENIFGLLFSLLSHYTSPRL